MLSIITPVLNGDLYIEKNIQSIQQLQIPYEHIIVDGGSTDNTIEIINKYPNLKLITQQDKSGMYGGIHLGFLEARGKYICWINSDDMIIADAFSKMYSYAIVNKIDFINSDGFCKFEKENYIKKIKGTKYARFFLKRGILPFSQPASLYKKSLYIDVGGFNLGMKIAGDIELFYRMAQSKNIRFGYFKHTTTIFVKHGDSLGDLNSSLSIEERKKFNIPDPDLLSRVLYKISKL